VSSIFLRLSEVRKRRHLSQRALAAMAGIRPDTVSELERGVSKGIQFETLARLCAALDVTPGDLFELRLDAIDQHEMPVLGGADEDEILRARLGTEQRIVDGASFVAELMREVTTDRGPAGEAPEAMESRPEPEESSALAGQSA